MQRWDEAFIDRQWDQLSERDRAAVSLPISRMNWWGRRIEMFLGLAIGILVIIAVTLIFGPPAWTSWFN